MSKLIYRNQFIIFLFLLLFSAVNFLFAANTGKIAGRVTDGETGEPLPGVNVYIEGTALGSATDENGDYFILKVPPGTYTVVAQMVGYATVRKTEVLVSVDRTIRVDFELKPQAFEGEEVVVVAERDAVELDVSASQISTPIEQIEPIPLVQDVEQFINLQAGIEDGLIRGGGLDQTGMVVDGLNLVDNEANEPVMMVNLSAIKEVSVIKGGFNAEYGNIRAGLINVVTKEGAWGKYNASVDFRYGVAHKKHRGASLFDWNNFYLRPYLDPAVCWVGTRNGTWDEYTQKQYQEFEGWDAFVKEHPEYGLTPEEARNLFIWQHRAKGSKELGHPHPGKYGDKPDYNLDLSFSGPIPMVGKYLGNMTFFASHRVNIERPVLPSSRDQIYERNSMLKLTSAISPSMKLNFEGIIGRSEDPGGYTTLGGEGFEGVSEGSYDRGIYFPHGYTPTDVDRYLVGVGFDHVLSPSTFYNIRMSVFHRKTHQLGAAVVRDTTTIRTFGNIKVDEQPYGWLNRPGYLYTLADNMVIGGVGAAEYNLTKVTTYNIKFDLTSQVNKANQVKFGFEFNYDNFDVYYGYEGFDPTSNYVVDWNKSPYRFGAYVQDKLEFQEMIANIGVRVDYNDPNTDWYTADRYSKYFSRVFKNQFLTKTPTERAKGKLKIAPRIGVSHPITEKSKLYFNYGHFYSMPPTYNYYTINFGLMSTGISELGNPNLDLPRTIAYELGYEHEIGNMFLVSLAGYYRDITNQVADRTYINYDGSVNYVTYDNSNYEDIRGFELRLEKQWGRWITWWLNYNYMVRKSGYYGREVYYQDPRQQANYGLRNPKQEKFLPEPFARANLRIRTPEEWGPAFGKIHPLDQISLSILGQYKAGAHFTWDPVAPFTKVDNIQWQPYYNFDLRISKNLQIGRYNIMVFADIFNVFNIKRLTGMGFRDEYDFRDYMKSLHLPMYKEAKYKNSGFVAGDDKPGDVRSKDKPYIDMPDINFMAWNPPRSIVLGLKFNF